MNVLVVGQGGREHALSWKISLSPEVKKVYCAPGNAGTQLESKVENIKLTGFNAILEFVKSNKIDLVVVGPEQPLVDGLSDQLRSAGVHVFGPNKDAAKLEGSKVFAKTVMAEANVPTASYDEFTEPRLAFERALQGPFPIVIKADGLAAGKGVAVCESQDQVRAFEKEVLNNSALRKAGDKLIVEEFLQGRELSVIALCSGTEFTMLRPARDYKRAFKGNQGPNTGGMGAFTPVCDASQACLDRVASQVIAPTLATLQERGMPFQGALYAGLMVENDEPSVLEFNVRFGDPETQPLLYSLKSDLFPYLFQCARGEGLDADMDWLEGTTIGVVLASRGYPAAYETGYSINGIDQAENQGVKVFHAGTVFDSGEIKTSGGRVLCVTGQDSDAETARQKVYNACELIVFDGKTLRSDIGC